MSGFSKYPIEIDTLNIPVVVDGFSPLIGSTVNRLRDAILASQSELGIKPSGIYGTVRARLDFLEANIGGGDGYEVVPGGSNGAIQFNNFGIFGGASRASISSDGYLQLGKDSPIATKGDLRVSKDFTLYGRNKDNTDNIAIIGNYFHVSNTLNHISIGYNGQRADLEIVDSIQAVAKQFSSISTFHLDGYLTTAVTAYGPNTVLPSGGQGIRLVTIGPNLIAGFTNVSNSLTYDPFGGGLGYTLFPDRNTVAIGNPTAGFWLWSDPSTHHPTAQLPNGSVYDLISSNSPVGNNRSLQFNNSGIFGGANHSSISSDGYLQLSNDKIGGAATTGDLRVATGFSMFGKSKDGATDVSLIYWGEGTDILSIGARSFHSDAKPVGTAMYGETFTTIATASYEVGSVGFYGAIIGVSGPKSTGFSSTSAFGFSYPNYFFGSSREQLANTPNPFGDGYGMLLIGDRLTAATTSPSNGFWLWSDPSTHHPNIKLPNGSSYDLISSNAPTGNVNSIQFNNAGIFGGATHTSIAPDGYLQLVNDRTGGVATQGDLRFSTNAAAYVRSGDGSRDLAIFTILPHLLTGDDQLIIGSGLNATINDRFGGIALQPKYGGAIAAGFINPPGQTAAAIGVQGPNPFWTGAGATTRFSYAQPNFWINQYNNLKDVNMNNYNPFNDGYGYLMMSDVATVATGNPAAGFWMWSDATNHHPNVKLPNGTSYDLISSNAPVGNVNSVQFNNSGIFGGANHASISSDGYLQLGNDFIGGSAQSGDLRFSKTGAIYFRNTDNTGDIQFIKSLEPPFGSSNFKNVVSIGGFSSPNASPSTFVDGLLLNSNRDVSIQVNGAPYNGVNQIAGITVFANNLYPSTTSNAGISIWPNLAIGSVSSVNPSPSGGNQPFRDGYGILFISDVISIPTIAPTAGFDLWSSASIHEPTIKLPDGTVKSLLPQGSSSSLQYKNPSTGGLAGASNTFIDSDGYILINNNSNIKAKDHLGNEKTVVGKFSYDITNGTATPAIMNAIALGTDFIGSSSMDQIYNRSKTHWTVDLDGYFDGGTVQGIQVSRFNKDGTDLSIWDPDNQAIFIVRNRTNTSFMHDNNALNHSQMHGGGKGVIYIGNATTIPTTNPTLGNILYSDASDGYLKYRRTDGIIVPLMPINGSAIFTANGDLSGSATSQNVIKINGASVPASGSLTTGHVLEVSGASALSYGFIADANVSPTAAIAGTKISPNFGSQLVTTTGNIRADGYVGAGNGLYPTSGLFRAAAAGTSSLFTWTNSSGTTRNALGFNTSNNLLVADPNESLTIRGSQIDIQVGTASSLFANATSTTLYVSNNQYLLFQSNLATLAKPLLLGSTGSIFASSGALRCANNGGVVLAQRNSANSADLVVLAINATDGYIGGDISLSSRLDNINITSNTSIKLFNASTQLVSFTSTSNIFSNPISATGNITAFNGRLAQTLSNIQTTSTDGVFLQNTSNASVGVTVQYSPRIHWQGEAWNSGGSVTEAHDWITEVRPVTAAGTTSSQLTFGRQIAGGTLTNVLQIGSDASLSIGTNPATTGMIRLPNATTISFRNGANNADLPGISLDSSNRLNFGNSSVGISNFGAVNTAFNNFNTFGGGLFVIGIANANTNPTSNPTAGVIAYVDAADGYFKTRTRDGYVIALNGAGTGGGFTAGGDLSGSSTSQTISKLQTITLDASSPIDGYSLTYDLSSTSIKFKSAAGSGITASQHESLRQMVHLAGVDGPSYGFSSGMVRDITGGVLPTSIVWWSDATRTNKIMSKDLAYSGVLPTTIVVKIFAADGTTILEQLTDSVTYVNSIETTRTRTLS